MRPDRKKVNHLPLSKVYVYQHPNGTQIRVLAKTIEDGRVAKCGQMLYRLAYVENYKKVNPILLLQSRILYKENPPLDPR